MSDIIQNSAAQLKVAATVSAATVTTGISTFLEVVTPIIGFIASLTGLCLSIIIIYNAIRKDKRETRLLELKEKEHIEGQEDLSELNDRIEELEKELSKTK